jgi:hypothetical protein
MFLVEEKTSPNGQFSTAIYMRTDGLFEGCNAPGIEVCDVTWALPRLESFVEEELEL